MFESCRSSQIHDPLAEWVSHGLLSRRGGFNSHRDLQQCVAQSGRVSVLDTEGRWFKSSHTDQMKKGN